MSSLLLYKLMSVLTVVSCPDHTPSRGRDGLVNEVEFLGLEAYYGMYNHCLRKRLLKAPVSTKRNLGYILISGEKMY